LNCGVLYFLLARRLRGLKGRELVQSCRRITVAILFLAAAASVMHRLIPASFRVTMAGSVVDLLLCASVGLGAYLGVQTLLRSDEIRRFKGMMRARRTASPPIIDP
ncbi:MAG: hypothetical protein LC772_02985, partial [Chloroflexi bacterium]|nr:hypothetical protein [Chloroflexota bacterium]